MEIWLNCAWYKHPFPKNRFTLTSANQIDILRELNLRSIHYNPASYRPLPACHPKPGLCLDVSSPNALEDIPADWVEPAQDPESEHTRQSSASARRSELRQAHHAYRDTLRKSSDCLRQIHAGLATGSDHASNLVQTFVDQLVKEEEPLALTDVLHLNVLERAHAAHGLNTCLLSLLVGRELDLEPEELKILGMAGLLHDLGEQRLPSQIRLKTEPLTRAEKSLFELHPIYSQEMLLALPGIPPAVAEIAAQHHECLSGTGYPRRLTHDHILPLANIVRVVDEYQYLTNQRETPLRLHPNQALAELYVKRRQQLSPKVVVALVRVVSVYPPGTLVELTDGCIGIVLHTAVRERLRPVVMVYEANDSEFDTRLVDLNEQRELSVRRIVSAAELSSGLVERITPSAALTCLLEQR